MKHYTLILLFVLISCNHKTEKNEKQANRNTESQVIMDLDKSQVDSIPISKNDEVDLNQTKGLLICFAEFSIYIDNIEYWDEEGDLKKTQNDSVNVFLDIGEIIGGNSIKITDCKYDQIEIYQKFENSITIMNEGPHCDLINWKHYSSDWEKIKKNDNFSFIANSMTKEQMEQFIPIDLDEFKEAVTAHCGDNWTNLIKNVRNINEYPCGVGTSKIELKIVMLKSDSQDKFEKIIAFDIPMGC